MSSASPQHVRDADLELLFNDPWESPSDWSDEDWTEGFDEDEKDYSGDESTGVRAFPSPQLTMSYGHDDDVDSEDSRDVDVVMRRDRDVVAVADADVDAVVEADVVAFVPSAGLLGGRKRKREADGGGEDDRRRMRSESTTTERFPAPASQVNKRMRTAMILNDENPRGDGQRKSSSLRTQTTGALSTTPPASQGDNNSHNNSNELTGSSPPTPLALAYIYRKYNMRHEPKSLPSKTYAATSGTALSITTTKATTTSMSTITSTSTSVRNTTCTRTDEISSKPTTTNTHNPASKPASIPYKSKPISSKCDLPQPTRTAFDPWNSVSTGHQRAENRLGGSTSWMQSRSLKLNAQFGAGLDGGERVADTVGAGSKDFGKDGRKSNGGWVEGAKGLRKGGQLSLGEVWGVGKRISAREDGETVGKKEELRHPEAANTTTSISPQDLYSASQGRPFSLVPPTISPLPSQSPSTSNPRISDPHPPAPAPPKPIFSTLTFYINGSTFPLISDHKLKHLIAAHGGALSLSIARKSVTHVVLGTAANNAAADAAAGGCGGGLAAGKLQREIARMRGPGMGVRFVGVEWILESIRHGKRLPESLFTGSMNMKIAPKGQGSVLDMLKGRRG